MNNIDPIDIFIGTKLRTRRTMMSMSQETLGKAVGVTFQQIQKYERGANRIVVSKLYQFTKVLNVPITYFFEGLEEHLSCEGSSFAVNEEREGFEVEPLITKSSVDLLKRFSSISDPTKKKIITDLVRTFAEDSLMEITV